MKQVAVRNLRLCTKDCLCLYVCPTGATDTENSVIDVDKCLGCGVCARNCPTKAIHLERRPVQIITPVNSTHRFVLQAIEKGTLQNLLFDDEYFANHRAMAQIFGAILQMPPVKQALASKQFKSIYLDKLLSSQVNRERAKKQASRNPSQKN